MTSSSTEFERFAGLTAIAVGVGGLAYSIAFVTYLESGSSAGAKISSLLLAGGGVLSLPFLVAMYNRLREVDTGFASLTLLLGVLGAAGAAIHGAYDLANFIKPPGAVAGNFPNAVDPRGLATFGFSGLAILSASWLILKGVGFPRRLGQLGVVAGVLLIYVYLGRLIILNPKNPGLLTAAVLSGFVVNPIWIVWVGLVLLRRVGASTGATTASAGRGP